ncbi:MAG: ABC transporter permease [Spirochaetaceae bacterium]|nr:ABC transporter permease [Spirochaetaceae bacterium]
MARRGAGAAAVRAAAPGRAAAETTASDNGATTAEERAFVASQGQLVWRKFRRHKLAVMAIVVLGALYFISLFAEFFTPYPVLHRFKEFGEAPPTRVRFVSPTRGLSRPFVFARARELDKATFTYQYTDSDRELVIRFFVRSEEPFTLLGFIPWNVKLFGIEDPSVPLFLFGSDRLGRDVFSRTFYAGRVSLFIGFGGVFVAFILGVILGGMSGYYGGVVDDAIQRVIDMLLSIPTIPLWIALSAALPHDWGILKIYFAITIILALLAWPGLARVVRGKLISLREEDFVMAAQVAAAKNGAIIRRHLVPGFTSYLITHLTLAIPFMIAGETALSFLGLGIRAPAVSWGTLLQDAQSISVLALQPWLIIPAFPVILAVMMFNFVGDGLRDAADPYAT